MQEFLTTRELAELLRIKERKVYDLAASGEVPCSKATGKLLFPRDAVHAWIARHSCGPDGAAAIEPPNVFLGSHDPLLDWALRESQCGLASYFDGSSDGLRRFGLREGIAAGLHLYDAGRDAWNTPAVAQACAGMPIVLVEWSKRQRGIIVASEHAGNVRSVADLAGLRVAPRQAASGAQELFLHLLHRAGIASEDLDLTAPVRNEADVALSVLEGKCDAGIGLAALAAQYRLPFVPLVEERFDLLVDRRAWFEPPMQTFLAFCRGPSLSTRAADLAGYDVTRFGKVHFNGQ